MGLPPPDRPAYSSPPARCCWSWLITLADAQRRQSIDHYQFTRLIAAEFDLGQKMVLAELMWGVILADGELATHETWLVRKLAHLLELEPGYLSQARQAAAGKRP